MSAVILIMSLADSNWIARCVWGFEGSPRRSQDGSHVIERIRNVYYTPFRCVGGQRTWNLGRTRSVGQYAFMPFHIRTAKATTSVRWPSESTLERDSAGSWKNKNSRLIKDTRFYRTVADKRPDPSNAQPTFKILTTPPYINIKL